MAQRGPGEDGASDNPPSELDCAGSAILGPNCSAQILSNLCRSPASESVSFGIKSDFCALAEPVARTSCRSNPRIHDIARYMDSTQTVVSGSQGVVPRQNLQWSCRRAGERRVHAGSDHLGEDQEPRVQPGDRARGFLRSPKGTRITLARNSIIPVFMVGWR